VRLLILLALCALQTLHAQSGTLVVTNAADYSLGLPNRGSLACIFLTGLDVSAPLRVTVAGLEAPVLAAADLSGYQQINIQVPMHDRTSDPSLEVTVEQGPRRSVVAVPVLANSPGEFFQTASRLAILQHSIDYSLVTPANPAVAGEAIVAYLTGMPDTRPLMKTGEPAPFDPLAIVPVYKEVFGSESYLVQIAGAKAEPLYTGLAPGLIGVYQVNFVMPSTSPGLQPLQLIRVSCRAFFGSCAAGGGIKTEQRSHLVYIPVR
jgi:uncharacterized protein (TIGR03437 family)